MDGDVLHPLEPEIVLHVHVLRKPLPMPPLQGGRCEPVRPEGWTVHLLEPHRPQVAFPLGHKDLLVDPQKVSERSRGVWPYAPTLGLYIRPYLSLNRMAASFIIKAAMPAIYRMSLRR